MSHYAQIATTLRVFDDWGNQGYISAVLYNSTDLRVCEMLTTDWSLLINWLVSGIIGLLFGVALAYATYRLQRVRDEIAWEREKVKMTTEWEHEREKIEAERRYEREHLEAQRKQDLEKQNLHFERTWALREEEQKRKEAERIRLEIVKGVDQASLHIRALCERDKLVLRSLIQDHLLASQRRFPDQEYDLVGGLQEMVERYLPLPDSDTPLGGLNQIDGIPPDALPNYRG